MYYPGKDLARLTTKTNLVVFQRIHGIIIIIIIIIIIMINFISNHCGCIHY